MTRFVQILSTIIVTIILGCGSSDTAHNSTPKTDSISKGSYETKFEIAFLKESHRGFGNSNYCHYVMDLDSNKIIPFKEIPFQGYIISLSPSGQKLLVVQYSNSIEKFRTYVVDLNSSRYREVFSNAIFLSPTWSPDNNFIANIELPSNQIRIYRLDNESSITLNFKPSSKITHDNFLTSLSWSTDGKTLVTSNLNYAYLINIFTKKVDSINLQKLSTKYHLDFRSETHISLSPDNKHLIFDAFKPEIVDTVMNIDAQAIYKLDLTTEIVERLTPEGLIAYEPIFTNKNEFYFIGTSGSEIFDDAIYKSNLTDNKMTKIIYKVAKHSDFSSSYND